jgi:cytosine/adenosine deaminase-related metal-dependent hydrolase
MSAGTHMLANVLVCAGGNRLRRADVFFDERIRRIALRDQTGADWSELRQLDHWQRYLANGGAPPDLAALPKVDGGGMLLIPGAVDAHVHFNTARGRRFAAA